MFDFDGTLTARDSFFPFLYHLSGKRLPVCARRLLPFSLRLAGAVAGLCDRSSLKERILVKFLKGYTADERRRMFEDFISEIDSMLIPEVMERLNAATEAVIVSASLREMIEPWARSHGVAAVIATELAYDGNDRVCGFRTANCKGREKVRRLREYLLQTGTDTDRCEITAYGNSRADIPMLEFSHKAFMVIHRNGKYELDTYR